MIQIEYRHHSRSIVGIARCTYQTVQPLFNYCARLQYIDITKTIDVFSSRIIVKNYHQASFSTLQILQQPK